MHMNQKAFVNFNNQIQQTVSVKLTWSHYERLIWVESESDNNGRWTTYRIKQKVDTSTTKVDTSQKVNTSPQSADNPTKTDERVDTIGKKVDTSDRMIDTPAKIGARMNRTDLETQIMSICKHDFVKMEAVAQSIGKSVDYLKNKIFPVMMKDGKLVKRYPYTHNHPEQGYKTNEEYAEGL
jgi:ATP-dependent DNA helicase RecG